MATQLESLKALSKVVADTGDLEAIKKYQPYDSTTNPSLLLKAFDLEGYQELIDKTLAEVKKETEGQSREARLEHAVDRLSVVVGTEITKLVPGRVSTEVASKLSFDQQASIDKARKLVELYEKADVSRDRILIKLASTWEGIRAAEILQKEGINCNLTLLFSDAQARACFEAGVFLISPFVGRVTDWYKQRDGVEHYAPDDDPGVKFVRGVADYSNRYGYETVVMGASFRNTDQIKALAGLNRLTISPNLLEELANSEGEVERKLTDNATSGGGSEQRGEKMTEAQFRWEHNQDAMANDKLAEGIRKFAEDQEKLEGLIEKRM
ncbi:transaldolase [Kushneria phosphatilytica]|uniref:Transaldolase n=1 Tax=Kushneria phosphatilytica TaxID=657387 RepID=A0A1S1NQD6_9GAMM|nr:transaldolase [Kushneria phosphatilytica]OHV07703.1 transaldolase [Kushneria phosphatilytica]QEL10199.1 transaldolase [Kushneria phosphatilytica]